MGREGMMLEIKLTPDVEDSRMGENPRGAHNGCDANKSVCGNVLKVL